MVIYVVVSSQGAADTTREESLAFSPMFDVLMVLSNIFLDQGLTNALRE